MPVTQQRLMLGQFYEVVAMIPLGDPTPLSGSRLHVVHVEKFMQRVACHVPSELVDCKFCARACNNQIVTAADNVEPRSVLDEIHEADLDKFNTFVEDVQRSYCEDFCHNIYSCLGLNFFSVNVIALSSDFGTAPRA